MDKKEWKEAFKKHRNDLMQRRGDIVDILSDSNEEYNYIIEQSTKSLELAKKMDALLKEGKVQEYAEIFKEYSKSTRGEEIFERYSEEITTYIEELDRINAELSKKVERCPECNGSGDKVTWEWITTDGIAEQVSHTEKCELCDGRGEAPVSELLDP